MNRISSFYSQANDSRVSRAIRSMQQGLQEETETRLRDMAYVLSLTRRIKDEIIEERNASSDMSA